MPKRILYLFAIVHLVIYSMVSTIFILVPHDASEIDQIIYNEAPVLKPLLDYAGLVAVQFCVPLRVFLRIISVLCFIFPIEVLLFLFGMYKYLHRSRKRFSAKTYALQIMLIKALTVQMINLSVFILFPIGITTLLTSFRLKYTAYLALFFLFLVSFNGIADMVAILVFIKPYQKYVLELVNIDFKKNNFRNLKLFLKKSFVSKILRLVPGDGGASTISRGNLWLQPLPPKFLKPRQSWPVADISNLALETNQVEASNALTLASRRLTIPM